MPSSAWNGIALARAKCASAPRKLRAGAAAPTPLRSRGRTSSARGGERQRPIATIRSNSGFASGITLSRDCLRSATCGEAPGSPLIAFEETGRLSAATPGFQIDRDPGRVVRRWGRGSARASTSQIPTETSLPTTEW